MILDATGKPVRTPEKKEIAGARRDIDLVMQSIWGILPNPDPILKRIGKDIKVYEEIKSDGFVWGVLTSRKSGVLSKPWDVLPASDETRDKEIADFVKTNLQRLNLWEDISQMLDAVPMGFSVMETMWEQRENRWQIAELKSRAQKRFNFDLDGQLLLKTPEDPLKGEPVPPAKFIISRHCVEDDNNPYGTALASKLYWPWFFKKHGLKFWAIFAEKFGMPTAVGTYPMGIGDDEKQKLLDALVAIVQDAAITVPQGTDLDFVEAKGTGTVYEKLTGFCKAEISITLLGQTLTTELGGTGSYAAAKVHAGVRQDIVEQDAKMVEEPFNTQLIPWLVRFNFGPVEPPKFVIETEEEDLNKDLAERDEVLQKMGYPFTQEYISERFSIPLPEEDEKVLSPIQGAAFAAWEKVSPVVARGETLGLLFESALKKGGSLIDRFLHGFKKNVEQWRSLNRAALTVNGKDLDALGEYLFNVAVNGYLWGQFFANKDLEQALSSKFREFQAAQIEILPFEEAIKYFSQLVPIDYESFMSLAGDLRAKYFTIAKVDVERLIGAVKNEIVRAMEEGRTLQEFREEVDSIFDRAGVTRLNPYHLETTYRTNIQTAYSAGMWDKFHDPDVADVFPYFMYSAVLDARTRPTHRAMDGFVARRDDPIWEQWWPPNGFSCRCDVVAISTAQAKSKGIKPSPPPIVMPDKGFNRNPKAALVEMPPGKEPQYLKKRSPETKIRL